MPAATAPSLPVLPPVRHFQPGAGGGFTCSGGNRVIARSPELQPEAELLAGELSLRTADAEPTPGDIVLCLGAVDGVTSDQGYRLEVDGVATVTAPSRAGAFNGTRTLLHLLAAGGPVPSGVITDEPAVEVRSLHVDAARKYFSPAWFEEQLRHLAALKLNQLQYHFSENEGFRLECESHPEIVSEEYLTKAQVTDLIGLAGRYHIEVVPALDVPGHMAQALRAHPEWRASDTAEGSRILDYSKPEVRAFVEDLIDEYAPLFPSTVWHLGGDEVFALTDDPVEERFPQLHQYAKEAVGPEATLMDGYVHYLNTVTDYLRGKGKTQVRAWNDALYTPGTSVALDPGVDVAYWTKWHESMPSVETILERGHRLLNFNDRHFYYVLTTPGRAYFTKPTAEDAYDHWTPAVFPTRRDSAPQVIDPGHPALLGASLSIWCDVPEAESEEEVAEGIRLLLRAMATRAWDPTVGASYSDWLKVASSF